MWPVLNCGRSTQLCPKPRRTSRSPSKLRKKQRSEKSVPIQDHSVCTLVYDRSASGPVSVSPIHHRRASAGVRCLSLHNLPSENRRTLVSERIELHDYRHPLFLKFVSLLDRLNTTVGRGGRRPDHARQGRRFHFAPFQFV